ncbi:MAG: nicotinamide-nucleotide amidohydrolase family protein [Hymenobacteraceae bacterium]|nr:nicotinamide-nucleotide amidohydrolase family protein [Hymenobacteraceae bacterium]MDX5397130.1 nicotinamide-nucleotide amidohydrolase family protein [Hymenobacteraceae bacterium]MDX5513208.1 nicotinamide-nucleotide amidohydrolase family protein [Hymenobacteraceae bacterium]
MSPTELNSIAKKFLEKKCTVAFAESCTAGLLASEFVKANGTSDIFLGSIVTYHEFTKEQVLGVKKQTLKLYTAESQQVTNEMVMGLQKLLKADMCVAVTGLCGKGASENEEKPVGSIFISIYFNKKVEEFREEFKGDCDSIRKKVTDFIFQKMGETIDRENKR